MTHQCIMCMAIIAERDSSKENAIVHAYAAGIAVGISISDPRAVLPPMCVRHKAQVEDVRTVRVRAESGS